MLNPNLTNSLTSGASDANPLAGLFNGNATAARNGANLGADGVSFSQTLSREMAQRQAGTNPGAPSPAPAPQQAPKSAQQSKPAEKAPDAKPAQADNQTDANKQAESSASADAAPADKTASTAAEKSSAKPADDSASASKSADESTEDQQVADANAAVTPVTDMLALMASLAKPAAQAAQAADPAAAAATADAIGGIGKGGKGSAVSTDPGAIQALQDAADDAAATSFATALTKTVAALGEGKGKPVAMDGQQLALPKDGAAKDLKLDLGTAAAAGKATDLTDAAAKPSAATAAARADAQGAPAAATTSATPQAEYATERLHIQTPAEQAALHDLQPTLAPAAAQVQAANSLEATQAAAAAGGERLSARVGTNAWENQVGQKIVWMAAGGDQSAELTLNPPDLGPMQVVLSVSNDQASVAFTAAQPEVRAALESALPRLKEMMSESGLSLGNATVNAGNPGQQDQQQRMAGNAAGQGQGNGNRYGNDNGNAPAAVNEVQPNAPRTQRLDRGLVDLFA